MTQLLVATYTDGTAVTPSDTAFVSGRAVYIGGLGNVTLVTESGVTLTFTAVPIGTILPVAFTQIKATLTTATLMVALR